MDLLKIALGLGKLVQKSDVAKGCLIGSATTLGTGGAVYIAKKFMDAKLAQKTKSADLNIDISK